MNDTRIDSAAAEEIASLRAEVDGLRNALHERQEVARPRYLMEIDPELPGVVALWRGERGLVWQLFVQATLSVNVVLAVVGIIVIAAS